MQRALVAQPWLRERIFTREIDWVRQWHAEVGAPADVEEVITINLLANTWVLWRRLAFSNPAVVGKWLILTGQPQWLLAAPPRAGGAVIALPHVGRLLTSLRQIRQRGGRETARVVGPGEVPTADGSQPSSAQKTHARAEQVWTAQQVLQRHGVVFIAADGLQGQQSIAMPLWGRRRLFQTGAAELAVTTGAWLIPTWLTFDGQGRVRVEVTGPLTMQATTTQAQVTELTRRYAEEYAARWPQSYASMRWGHLAHNLRLPVM
jgi:lauroyl/myristoyl acyltransferase